MNNSGCKRIRERREQEEKWARNRQEQKNRFLKKIGR